MVFLIVGVGAFGCAKKNPSPAHQTAQQTAIELPELSDSASLPQHSLALPVTRKDSPKLKQLLDEFIEGHRLETSFGNILFRRYLQNTKWVKDSTTSAEMKKFKAYVESFKKYAAEYNFDYLMLASQGYQESMLDQSRRSSCGAVGIMQVIPSYAAAHLSTSRASPMLTTTFTLGRRCCTTSSKDTSTIWAWI